MAREKKDAKAITIKLATPVYENLETFCDETGMSKTMAMEKILQQYFDGYFKRPENERKLFK